MVCLQTLVLFRLCLREQFWNEISQERHILLISSYDWRGRKYSPFSGVLQLCPRHNFGRSSRTFMRCERWADAAKIILEPKMNTEIKRRHKHKMNTLHFCRAPILENLSFPVNWKVWWDQISHISPLLWRNRTDFSKTGLKVWIHSLRNKDSAASGLLSTRKSHWCWWDKSSIPHQLIAIVQMINKKKITAPEAALDSLSLSDLLTSLALHGNVNSPLGCRYICRPTRTN